MKIILPVILFGSIVLYFYLKKILNKTYKISYIRYVYNIKYQPLYGIKYGSSENNHLLLSNNRRHLFNYVKEEKVSNLINNLSIIKGMKYNAAKNIVKNYGNYNLVPIYINDIPIHTTYDINSVYVSIKDDNYDLGKISSSAIILNILDVGGHHIKKSL